jgi:hypothetical protein
MFFVCWSIAQMVKHADRVLLVIHAQGKQDRTLCGIR